MRSASLALMLSLAVGCYAGLEDVTSSVKLTASNFDSSIRGKNALVAFFAPWCGHCKSLEPAWQALGKDFADEDTVVIGHLDADNQDNRPVAERYDVKGYPTLKFFPADGSGPRDYEEGRTEQAFIDYINARAGTHRTAGGLLNELAGRLPDFDALLSRYLSGTEEVRADLLAQAKQLAQKLKVPAELTAAGYYIKVFDKLSQSSDWAQKELSRLQKLAGKRTAVAGKQLDEMRIRQNILSAFDSLKAGASSVVAEAGASASLASSVLGKGASSILADAGASASSVSSQVSASAASVIENVSGATKSMSGAASAASKAAANAASDVSRAATDYGSSAASGASSAASVASASAKSAYNAASGAAQRVVDEL